MDAMSEFYGQVLGLKQVSSEKGWREFAAGGARISQKAAKTNAVRITCAL